MYLASVRFILYWEEVPDIKQLRENAGILSMDGASNETRDPDFSLSEFGRLVVLLKEDPETRTALLKSSQPLARSQIDARVSSFAFWDTMVAKRFNDEKYAPKFDMRGTLPSIETSVPPSCNRSGAVLREHFDEARRYFSTIKDKWERSGQNDPGDLGSFCRRRRFGEYTANAKRLLILFVTMGCGDAL